MADNQSAIIAKTNIFKGMVKDTTDIFMNEGMYSNAINAINNTHYGETGSIGNEPSNELCSSAPYTIIGYAHKQKSEWVLFSTNDIDSEIGLFDESKCSYTKIVSDKCLGFKRSHLISCIIKENYDCTFSAYFADSLNNDRVLNLNNVPYKCTITLIDEENRESTCVECIENTPQELDCDKLRLHPLVTQPCLTINKSNGAGQLNNGSYIAFVAYSENGIRLTDYSMPSNPQGIWGHTGIGGAIDIHVDGLDQDFDEYELVVVAIINQQTIAKKIGHYSIRQKIVSLDLYQQSLETVQLSVLPLKSAIYDKSEKMYSVNGYLIRSGVTTRPKFNYQPLANKIIANWIAVEYPMEYYWHGGNNVGNMRDEIYPYFIRWIYNTGARSSSYHIPGRESVSSDNYIVQSQDVLYGKNKNWQVYDTSSVSYMNGTTTTSDGGVIKYKGTPAYWESTEKYPDDKPEIWGDLCGKPIRHHKMPSNEKNHIHDNAGLNKIYVLGMQFSNISHPLDENGLLIEDIVGYEILRGSREGNRSILAKGLFNNMLEYPLNNGSTKKGLIQNYPYNDVRPDEFLSSDKTIIDNGSGKVRTIESSTKLSNYKKDHFSFHSVETNFIKPYLGDVNIKLYTEEIAIVNGKFELPYKHPRFKILTDFAFGNAVVVGFGIAVVSAIGRTTIEGSVQKEGSIFFATLNDTNTGVRSSGTASAIGDLASAITTQGLSLGVGQVIASVAGIAAMAANIAYYTGAGVNESLGVIRNMSKYKDYLLQYNSHGFYNKYAEIKHNTIINNTTVSINSIQREISNSNAKYISAGIQDFDNTYRINNLNRNKYVALKTNHEIEFTINKETSKKSLNYLRNNNSLITHKNPFNEFQSNAVSYYGALKVDFDNQYGQLESIVQIPTSSCINDANSIVSRTYTSSEIFGGDTYINRYTEKNPFYFFNTWLIDVPDGTEFEYRNYINGPIPRYWVDFNNFDISDVEITWNTLPLYYLPPTTASIDIPAYPTVNTPSTYHRLDRSNTDTGVFLLKNCWSYLSYNGVRDFYTESELNIAYRDYGEDDTQKFFDPYGNSFNDLSTMFRSDLIKDSIYHKYDLSLSASKLFTNFASWGNILPRDYTPQLYSTCFEYYPNRVIYSLQQQSGLKRDNWRNFLPLNYKDFNGKVSSIKAMDATGSIILFEDSEPLSFQGTDSIQTAGGVKLTIGDGTLFNERNIKNLVNADDSLEYGSNISYRSTINTPFGLFYISQKAGKIFQLSQGLEEISKNGMKFWFAENLPSYLLKAYPEYPLYDNPVKGIGCQTVFDSQYELIYFTKKDYIPLDKNMSFDEDGNFYTENSITIEICDVCPDGYTYNPTTKVCDGYQLINATPADAIELTRTPYSTYGAYGTKVHSSNLYTSSSTILNTSNPFWIRQAVPGFAGMGWNDKQLADLNNGPVNRIVVWGKSLNSINYPVNNYNSNLVYNIKYPKVSTGFAGDTFITISDDTGLAGVAGGTPSSGIPSYFITGVGIPFGAKFETTYTSGTTVNLVDMYGTPLALANDLAPLTIVSFLEEISTLSGQNINPILQWTGFNTCIDIAEDKTYYFAMAADNGYKLTINGTVTIVDPAAAIYVQSVPPSIPPTYVIQSYNGPPSGSTDDFTYLHIYPVNLLSGLNSITMEGYNIAHRAGFGIEIYDLSSRPTGVSVIDFLNAQTDYSNIDVIFSTRNETYFTGTSFTCPDGSKPIGSTLCGDVKCKSLITQEPSCREVEIINKKYCPLENSSCFTPVHWTVSYDPKLKMWVSFHDWHPNLMIPSYKHFYTIDDKSLWKHNNKWDSFCKYYDKDYPWEIEYPLVTPNQITTIRNVEYTLDTYKFYNNGKDFNHILDENFDQAIIYNSEQISGLLKLRIKGKNSPLDLINYPIVGVNGIEILYSKEENKFRFNQFWDITKDRGEFIPNTIQMWNTNMNGYQKIINPSYVKYNKQSLQHKKFRHYGNKIILRKSVSGDKKMILKLTNSKHLNSSR